METYLYTNIHMNGIAIKSRDNITLPLDTILSQLYPLIVLKVCLL
jgi:hypothetical protein